jgi:tetratricopeptide (TPR) repeat protein
MSSPSLPEFEFEIGARIARGDLVGASAVAAGCRAAWPADAAGWLLGSIAALLADHKEAALALVEARLAQDPADLQCLLQAAECRLALGQRARALAAADAVLVHAAAAGPEALAAALDAAGEFFVHAAEHARALEVYDRAVANSPDDAALLSKRAVVERFLGAFNEAEADYARVLELVPQDPEALKGLAELRRQSTDHNAIPAMEAALAAAPTGSPDAATLHFGLAKSYEDLGDHAASWRHLRAGNQIERSRIQYDASTDRAVIDRIIEDFPAQLAGQTQPKAASETAGGRPDARGASPIFIVGLPRTGTTLVERILGSHSQVHAAGELPALSEAIGAAIERAAPAQTGGWLDYAAQLAALDGEFIAREYLARARARRGDRARFTDKQPTNFFHCGLIFRAFPNARVVHLTRGPLAACYAIYKTRFGGTYSFSYELDELADFYIGYRRLMTHWHRVLPNRILDVAYEDVVTAQEPTTRRLLAYLDLPFEQACLDFHRNPSSTATASAVQVRQPLYDSSLQQWRHYADELAPLRARLAAAGIAID